MPCTATTIPAGTTATLAQPAGAGGRLGHWSSSGACTLVWVNGATRVPWCALSAAYPSGPFVWPDGFDLEITTAAGGGASLMFSWEGRRHG